MIVVDIPGVTQLRKGQTRQIDEASAVLHYTSVSYNIFSKV